MTSGWVKFVYSGEIQAMHVAAWLVSSSKAFTVEPYPDDAWVFHVKQEWAENMPRVLIPAAPEMLTALKSLVSAVEQFTNIVPEDWPEIANARAVIAKSEGA